MQVANKFKYLGIIISKDPKQYIEDNLIQLLYKLRGEKSMEKSTNISGWLQYAVPNKSFFRYLQVKHALEVQFRGATLEWSTIPVLQNIIKSRI